MNTRHFFLALAGSLTMQMVHGQDWNRLPGGDVINTTEYLGAALGSTVPLQLKTVGILPIDFYTTNTFRMRLNPRVTYPTFNGFSSVVADGFGLLSPNASFLATAPYGPFSRLHLADGTYDTQNFGYRSWQRNGITFTGNDDQGYIGQKYANLDETDMVIQWSDNPGFTKAAADGFTLITGHPDEITNVNSRAPFSRFHPTLAGASALVPSSPKNLLLTCTVSIS